MYIARKTNGFAWFALTLLVLTFCNVANAAGNEVDLTFTSVPSKDLITNTSELALQPDGKIIIYGDFEVVNGVPKQRFARLNADGTLDTSFSFDPSSMSPVTNVVVQPDGKIIVSGSYGVPKLIRLNSDGSLDGTFTSPFQPCFGLSLIHI